MTIKEKTINDIDYLNRFLLESSILEINTNQEFTLSRSKEFYSALQELQFEIVKEYNDLSAYFSGESKHFKMHFMTSLGIVTDSTNYEDQYVKLLEYSFPNL